MSILEKEISVTLNSANMNHYKNLNYDIPKSRNKWGKLQTPRGTQILVKVEDLTDGCKEKVTKVCDDCGKHIPDQNFQTVIKSRARGKDKCSSCSYKYSWEKRIDEIEYQRTFEYAANEKNMSYLLNEFSNKNKLTPDKVFYGSNYKYWWKCPDCKSEYDMHIHHRLKGDNCPYCSGHRVNHTNCLSMTHPRLALEWHPYKNGDLNPNDVSYGMSMKIWWVCEKGHKSYKSSINSRTSVGCGCPECTESKGERRIREWLIGNDIEFTPQKEYEGLLGLGGKNLSFDFYLHSYNTLIEYQGEFHDGSSGKYAKSKLNKQQEHDRRKKEYSQSHNIDLLEIWYWDFDNIEEILNQYIKQAN